jgi:hypothetical protein
MISPLHLRFIGGAVLVSFAFADFASAQPTPPSAARQVALAQSIHWKASRCDT